MPTLRKQSPTTLGPGPGTQGYLAAGRIVCRRTRRKFSRLAAAEGDGGSGEPVWLLISGWGVVTFTHPRTLAPEGQVTGPAAEVTGEWSLEAEGAHGRAGRGQEEEEATGSTHA